MQNQFRRRIGEVAYTPNQISKMICQMGLGWYSSRKIRNYVKKNDLFVELEKVGIKPPDDSLTRYWVPKSNLGKIIDGFNIPATEKDFENAADSLNFQA